MKLRAGSDAGLPLLVGQPAAVDLGGGTETTARAELCERAWVLGTGVEASALLAAPHVPYPVPAPTAPDRAVKTLS